MNTLLWVVVGILLYTALAMGLKARGVLPESLRVSGPILTVHTKRGRAFLDRLAQPRRFWRAWGNFGVGIALVVMAGSFLAVLVSAYLAMTQPEGAAITRPQNVLVIPGVNEFLPLGAAIDIVAGLVIALVVHEGGHGLLCRVEDIEIDTMGVALFALVPLGAFVAPDEESRERADRGGKTRMFAAGVTNNFAVTLIAFVLLFGPVVGSIAVVPGVPIGGVLPGSAAAEAGIERGDVITSVDGQEVEDVESFETALAEADREVVVERREAESVTIERSLVVTRAVVDAPLSVDPEDPTRITAVDGEQVHTRHEFDQAVTGTAVVELETTEGTVSLPVGVYASTVPRDGPLGEAGVPERPVLVQSVGGEPTPSPEALSTVLADREPGETVEVVVFVGDGQTPWTGDQRSYEVTLGAQPDGDGAFLGVAGIREGISGIVVNDFGIDPYPAEQYLAVLGAGGSGEDPVSTFIWRTGAVLVLPFASVIDPAASYNFAGFIDPVTNFYTIDGPLAVLGAGLVFGLANVLFWTGWVNLNLGFFNCIPAYPLDGGHILRSCVEAVLARLPVDARASHAAAVTTTVSVVMIVSVLALLFVPQLLL